MRRAAWCAIWAALGSLATAGTVQALPFDSNEIDIDTPFGDVRLRSSVEVVEGDPSRWRFTYELEGSFQPNPGVSNGISSLQIFFGGIVDDVTGQTAPAGWQLNCCFSTPPFGVGFDIPGGQGAGANTVVFSFEVPAGTARTRGPQGSFAASYEGGAPSAKFVLLETAGEGPIVPVPEPGTLALLALGIGAIARRRS
jgi:hypothetical protein